MLLESQFKTASSPAHGLDVRFLLPVTVLRQLVAGWLQQGQAQRVQDALSEDKGSQEVLW